MCFKVMKSISTVLEPLEAFASLYAIKVHEIGIALLLMTAMMIDDDAGFSLCPICLLTLVYGLG